MPAPSLLDLDVLRASLGRSLTAPYERGFGAAPWLTAGTLTWPAGEAATVLSAWRAWAERLPASSVTAVRVNERVVAVDVALVGDPWGAPARLEPLRALAPGADSVGLAAPASLLGRRGGAPAPIGVVAAPQPALPDLGPLATARIPDGIALGARHDPGGGPALIALGIAADAQRLRDALSALDRALRARVGIG